MAKTKEELREVRKQKLPTVTTFSPRDSLSNFLRPSGGKRQSRASSPLDLPKEFFLLLRQYEEEMLDAFLQVDDIDYHFNKVKCQEIEMMMPQLIKMVENEMK